MDIKQDDEGLQITSQSWIEYQNVPRTSVEYLTASQSWVVTTDDMTTENDNIQSKGSLFPLIQTYVGALGFILVLLIALATALLCHKALEKRRKNRQKLTRLISNNDFSLRVSDVLHRNHDDSFSRPMKSRHVSYFRQESHEAVRFDRIYMGPGEIKHHSSLAPSAKTTSNTVNIKENSLISSDTLQSTPTPKNVRRAMETNEILGLSTSTLAKTQTNINQDPNVLKPETGVLKSHYQTPRSHYQIPKGKNVPNKVVYHTPKTARKISVK